MCVAAPDSVLAEAGAMKPRPSFASTLLTAEPSARLVWWPEIIHLEDRFMARLKWLAETSGGAAWLVIDPNEEESPSRESLVASLENAGLVVESSRALSRGETALAVSCLTR